jgi:hypothetical protein
VCSDVPLIFFEVFAEKLQLSTSVLSGQVLTVILGRPATVFLLIVSVFYLSIYAQQSRFRGETVESEALVGQSNQA